MEGPPPRPGPKMPFWEMSEHILQAGYPCCHPNVSSQ